MAMTIKQLIDKNKSAFDSGFLIESVNLSYILINKALKQIVKEEQKNDNPDQKIKTAALITFIKNAIDTSLILKKKISKSALRDINLFISLYKQINKELRYQYSEKKIADTSRLGLNCIIVLNTSLVKIKNNKLEEPLLS